MADKFRIEMPEVNQDVHINISGESQLKSIARTLNKLASDRQLYKYFKDQEELIEDTIKAYNKFTNSTARDSKKNANEFLKVSNALKAMSETFEIDLSKTMPNYSEIVKGITKAMSRVGDSFNDAFSKDSFKDAFNSFAILEHQGAELSELFKKFDIAIDSKQSQQLIEELTNQVFKLESELDSIREANGIEKLEKELADLKDKFRDVTYEAERTFESFLDLNNIHSGDYSADKYFEKIKNGSLTAKEAIKEYKYEFGYLLEQNSDLNDSSFGVKQLDEFTSTLNSIFIRVEAIYSKINDIMSNGVVTKAVENLGADTSISKPYQEALESILKDEEALKSLTTIFQNFIAESNKVSNVQLFDEQQLKQVIDVFEKIENNLSSMRTIISDVGDGEEFSPLLKQINDVQKSIEILNASMSNIGFNFSFSSGSNIEDELKVEEKVSKALQAYERLFAHLRDTSVGGQTITDKFFNFDINQYNTMMGKLQAYKKFIENMREEAKTVYGYDALKQDSDGSYWTKASSAMGQMKKQFNEMKKVKSEDGNTFENLFGKVDLSEITSQLNKIDLSEIVSQLNIIITKIDELTAATSSIMQNFVVFNNTTKNAGFDINKTFERSVANLGDYNEKLKTASKLTQQISTFSDGSKSTAYTLKYKDGSSITKDNTGYSYETNVLYNEKEINDVLKQQLKAYKEIHKLKAELRQTTYLEEANTIKKQIKDAQKSYSEAKETLKTYDGLYDRSAQLAELEKIKLEAEKQINHQLGEQEKKAYKQAEAEQKATEKLTETYQRKANSYNDDYEKRNIDKTDYSKSMGYQKALDEYKDTITALENKLKELNDTNIVSKEQEEQLESLNKKVIEAKKAFDGLDKSERGSDKTSRLKELDKITSYLSRNTRLSKEAKERLEEYTRILRSDNGEANVKQIHNGFLEIVDAERQAGREGKRFIDIFKDKSMYGFAAKLAMYYLSFYDFVRYARNAITTVIDLDTALIDLKKTTTMSSADLERFYYDANDVAKQMGVTTEEIINQASAWSRLGYSSKEASTEMAKLSSQFAQISPGMDLDTATDGLLSAMKAFGIEVEDAERKIADNINRIGNTAGTSNEEIVDMLTRSSAAMAEANNSIEETIALETAAVEITRNAETTGKYSAA